ncbi:hypothetical protein [Maridesulfovibrio frigidus]|uniref:hypothetical protein n=1 Tax=Maridesulfovibrio frigidus TaxID=340956 RepID=UPI0004E0B925|nr:hypothetical protein [Maridesulfovibrio frigidus]
MEIILVYAAIAAFILAIAGLFIPQKLVFWCGPDYRDKAMAFTTYLSLSIVLSVIFVIVVPEPPQAPAPQKQMTVEEVHPAQLTKDLFLRQVEQYLARQPNFAIEHFELSLLVFGREGATCLLLSSSYPNNEIARQHATQVVAGMVATFKKYSWKVANPFLIECQLQIDSPEMNESNQTASPISFARFEPDTGMTTWINLQ